MVALASLDRSLTLEAVFDEIMHWVIDTVAALTYTPPEY